MAQLGKLPDMAKAFNKLKICLELENLPNNSLIVSAIHKALARKDNDAAIEVVLAAVATVLAFVAVSCAFCAVVNIVVPVEDDFIASESPSYDSLDLETA